MSTASEWVPDANASRCGRCEKRFTLLRRKHHCRSCGGVFCDPCSSHRLVLGAATPPPIAALASPRGREDAASPLPDARRKRVCVGCYDRLHVRPLEDSVVLVGPLSMAPSQADAAAAAAAAESTLAVPGRVPSAQQEVPDGLLRDEFEVHGLPAPDPGEGCRLHLPHVVLLRGVRRVVGTLLVTDRRLAFLPAVGGVRPLSLHLGLIGRAKWRQGSLSLSLRSPRGVAPRFDLSGDPLTASFQGRPGDLLPPAGLAFAAFLDAGGGDAASFGWSLFDAAREYERAGLLDARGEYRLADINRRYSFCPSYPARFVVPAGVTNSQLVQVAKFRSRARVPAAVWRHPRSGAVLMRSAQPLPGLTGARCEADEALLAWAGPRILDARPRLNATAQAAAGGGYEASRLYGGAVEFLDMANVHAVRRSHAAAAAAVEDSSEGGDAFWPALAESDHLRLLAALVRGALRAALLLERGESVLVHCTDGWDRTPQVTSAAQLLLDPYYRTARGFAVLVEKEWLAFGHPFASRVPQRTVEEPDGGGDDDERSPVFAQWLDCVWQVLRQFPDAFEFTGALLEHLADQLYSGQTGTFLFSTELERNRADVRRRTASVWRERWPASFLNRSYRPTSALLEPDHRRIQLWGLYLGVAGRGGGGGGGGGDDDDDEAEDAADAVVRELVWRAVAEGEARRADRLERLMTYTMQ